MHFEVECAMTGLEFGQTIFSDALSSVKLHLLAKLSTGGHIRTGPIVDFQGSGHLSGKSFFIQHTQYALMVVLMNIHELMAGSADRLDSNEDTAVAYAKQLFTDPDWEAVVRTILELPLYEVERDPNKTVEIGPNQRKLINITPDTAQVLKINVEELAAELQDIWKKAKA